MALGPIHMWARVGGGSAERAEGRSAGAARAGKRARRSGAQPGLDLDEITAPRVREWRAERLRTTKAKTTVAKAYRLLKAILETAVDDDLITRNPCRIKGAGKESATERRIATVTQVDALANAIGIRWRLMVYLGAYGPMRPEELAASVAGT